MFGDVTIFARYVFFSPNFSFFVCATKNSKGFDPNRSNPNFLVYQLFHLFCSRVAQKWVWDCVICPYFFPGLFLPGFSPILLQEQLFTKFSNNCQNCSFYSFWLKGRMIIGNRRIWKHSLFSLVQKLHFVTSSEILGVWWKRSKAGNLEGSCSIHEV